MKLPIRSGNVSYSSKILLEWVCERVYTTLGNQMDSELGQAQRSG